MTEVGVRTLKENPNNFAPSTNAPSSIFRKLHSKYRLNKTVENFRISNGKLFKKEKLQNFSDISDKIECTSNVFLPQSHTKQYLLSFTL